MMKSLMLIAFIALCAGCASGISKSTKFDEFSETGLVVIGVDSKANFSMIFTQLNTSTQKLDPDFFTGAAALSHDGADNTVYSVLSISPGNYVLKSLSFISYDKKRGEYTNNIICMNKGTYSFEVEAGKVKYFGDLTFKNLRVSVTDGDLNEAKKILTNYPNIILNAERLQLTPTTFVNGKKLVGKGAACGGHYDD